jgi:hypothetical protein
VYLRENGLTVVLFEFGKGHGSADFKKMSTVLNEKLRNRYGAQRVKVD